MSRAKPPIVKSVTALSLWKGGTMNIRVSEPIYRLLLERAKRENKKLEALVNELMNKVLWNEPCLLFRGKAYQIEPDLFGNNEPKNGDIEPLE